MDGCPNSGELAPIVAHELGHGLDANPGGGGFGGLSSPGEGIADVYAALRFNDSCIGPGWRIGFGGPVNCDGYPDPCTNCDGVRDIDFEQHVSQPPHDVAWVNALCRVPRSMGTRLGPCGKAVHCEGRVTSESIWDLWHRDLPGTFAMDPNTALEVTTRLTYQAAAGVDECFTCMNLQFNGCDMNSGYMHFLTADDDDGDLMNGTPHMSAIFDAFNRHGAACDAPVFPPINSGCSSTPILAPTVTAVGGLQTVELSWNAVPNAMSYRIFRTEGVSGCKSAKS